MGSRGSGVVVSATPKNAERNHHILLALDKLPEEQREAFLLKQEGDLTLAEIAEITGVGRETVKSRLRYALTGLRRELADQELWSMADG